MFPALLPKSAPFFAMLNEQNDLLRRMSALLVNMLEDVSNMDHVHKEIAFLEEEADLLHSKIIRFPRRLSRPLTARISCASTRNRKSAWTACTA